MTRMCLVPSKHLFGVTVTFFGVYCSILNFQVIIYLLDNGRGRQALGTG